ncbi:hypothetical protein QQF64_022687, partial [Cirrhinus molitorella]
MSTPCALMCFLLVPVSVLSVSHTLTALATYIRGERAFSASIMLDDITVAHYNSETKIYVARGNNTNEDDVIDPNELSTISINVLVHFKGRSNHLRPVNNTESHVVYQVMCLCEQSDNTLRQMICKTAYRGSTIDELHLFDGKITYQVFSNYTAQEIRPNLEMSKVRLEKLYYPVCIKTLKNYLEKREAQVNRKVKPQVRLSQKANSNSGGSRIRCLATGFYPRHINLTLFMDGQPVSDQEITGGGLLPNGDGTYQMRKSLEISAADKHKYTCSASHLSLDNRMTVDLEYNHGEPFNSVIPLFLTILALVLMSGAAVIIWKKCYANSSNKQYSSASRFYPRHINLTLFRDGQPVADREITGGDLLPNGDGTYQIRKSLEISAADKHKYTCTATHLSLDNKLDVALEFDPGEPFKSIIPSVLIGLSLVLVFGTGAVIFKWKRGASSKSAYIPAS